jgi:hypothetical protein
MISIAPVVHWANPIVHWPRAVLSEKPSVENSRNVPEQRAESPDSLLDFSLVERAGPATAALNQIHLHADSFKSRATFVGGCALASTLIPEDSVVGSGSTEVGKGPTRKPGRPRAELSAGPDAFPKLRIDGDGSLRTTRVCGAMSQQNGDSGIVSAPQKFVHLVGCRDPKAPTRPWVRPRPTAQKQ